MGTQRSSLLARAFWLGSLALVAAGVLFVVAQSTGADEPRTRRCADIVLSGALGQRVTCRTESATLTIAEMRDPLIVDGLHARVLSARLDGRVLRLSLRVRNATPAGRRFERRQVYLRVAGERVRPRGEVARRVGAGRARTLRLRFVLDRRSAASVRRGRARAELGVVPWSQAGRRPATRLGVIRLEL
jgi:hypothetical protein